MKNPYADIIDLPHHVSRNHPQMPIHDRAAQFAPFAALTAGAAGEYDPGVVAVEKKKVNSIKKGS